MDIWIVQWLDNGNVWRNRSAHKSKEGANKRMAEYVAREKSMWSAAKDYNWAQDYQVVKETLED